MTTATDLLLDAFGRIADGVDSVLDGTTHDDLTRRVTPDANPVGWLVWHLTRVQDDHVAAAADTEQVWTSDGWHERLGVPFDASATGYGQSTDEVGSLDVDPDLLAEYHRVVHARTAEYLDGLAEDDLERIVDEAWDPPVTLAARLVSVVQDDLLHLGQAQYLRGL